MAKIKVVVSFIPLKTSIPNGISLSSSKKSNMDIKPIMRIVPTLQAASLVGRNFKLATKKKAKSGDFIKAGVQTMIGAEFIKAESSMIEGL